MAMADDEDLDDVHVEETPEAPEVLQLSSSEEEDEEAVSVLTEYDASEFFSTAVRSEKGTIPLDIFDFIHSFGYDCQRYYNLCACDENVVAWGAGSIATFYNIITKQITFRRSSTGGTVGHITKNPDPELSHIAIAEGGLAWVDPIIIIYQWPSMEIEAVLRDGTVRSFAKLDYSPDGNLLASIGGAPDYNLTIYDWRRHRIMLRTSAFSFNVNNVQFSPYIPGQLTTSGLAHIKFWKMAPTFTGLKLIGELGRFGKTEICDILGVWPMPDEKVLSGCTWGNVLVWENGLVKMEVCRKGRRPCHDGPITQFMRCAETAEVTSVGLDGHICVWFWETVEQFDPPENDPVMELNPVSEVFVDRAQLLSISRRNEHEWFAQDAKGSIWTVNLGTEEGAGSAEELTGVNAQRLVRTHGGSVVGLAALRKAPLLLSLGADGSLHLHRSPRGPLIVAAPSHGKASSMLYLPEEADNTGCIVILGYDDGTIRVVLIHTTLLQNTSELIEYDKCLFCLQSLKPHSETVTAISIAPSAVLLMTCSQDSTLFLYRVQGQALHPELQPLGYIPTPQPVHHICWRPDHEYTVLLSGSQGMVLEAELPHIEKPPVFEETTTYVQSFVAVKISTLKDYELRFEPPDEDDPNQMDALLSSSEEEEEEKDEFPPEIELMAGDGSTKTVVWASYDPGDPSLVWAAQDQCGCLLRLRPGAPVDTFIPLPGCWTVTLQSHLYIFEHRYLIIGTSEGDIRVIRRPTDQDMAMAGDEFTRRMRRRQRKLKRKKGRKRGADPELIPRVDLEDFLVLPMHDCNSGTVTQMLFSADNKYFFTAGGDGNIFSYRFNFDPELIPQYSSIVFGAPTVVPPGVAERSALEEPAELSHEQMAREREHQELLAIAAAHKQAVQDRLTDLAIQFRALLKRNRNLPPSQQVKMEADPRVLQQANQELEDQMSLVHRKLAFPLAVSTLRLNKLRDRNVDSLDVFPFRLLSVQNEGFGVKIIRQKKLTQKFFDDLEAVKKAIADEAAKARRSISEEELSTGGQQVQEGVEAPLLQNLPPQPPPPRSLARALRAYLRRLQRFHDQQTERREHLALLLDEPDDAVGGVAWALRQAEATIGEYHFKSQPQENAALQPPLLTQMLIFVTRQEIYEIQHDFNMALVELRSQKSQLVQKFTRLRARLQCIERELPHASLHPPPPSCPAVRSDLEFPETNLELREEEGAPAAQVSRRTNIDFLAERRARPFSERPVRHHAQPPPDLREDYWDAIKDKPAFERMTSPWEKEMKDRRITSLLVEQEGIFTEMSGSLEDWERQLQKLGRERWRVMLRAELLQLHLLRLTQEHKVLDSFYARETSLASSVQLQQDLVKVANDRIKMLQKQTESRRQDVLALQERCRQLEVQQHRLAANTRFVPFLRRVYRKKQKPPKLDDESSESMSSSEDEEDDESEDSGGSAEGVTRMRLDSTACPPGLDPQLWEETLLLREIRYDLENEIKEEERQIEFAKRDIETCQKEVKLLVINLQEKQNILRDVIYEKQTKLNDIDAVVVLQASQCAADALRVLCSGRGTALVFPAPTVSSLRARVLELLAEAEEQKKRHLINNLHLKQMRADSAYMAGRVAELRAQCARVLAAKLVPGGLRAGGVAGRLHASGLPGEGEAAAARLLDGVLADMGRAFQHAAAAGLTADMLDQLAHWQRKECELEKQYRGLLQEHTRGLRVAAALQAEVRGHKRGAQELGEWAGGRSEAEYRADLVRLRRLRREQDGQIEDLRCEVQKLRLRPGTAEGPPPPFSPDPRSATPRPPTPRRPDSSLASKLAQSLRNAGLALDASTDTASLDEIVKVLPLLITGKINSTEAADRVMQKISLKGVTSGADPLRELADTLGRITRHSVTLGEVPPGETPPGGTPRTSAAPQAGPVEATERLLRQLLQAGTGAGDVSAIDAAVAELLETVPHAADHDFGGDALVQKLLEGGQYGEQAVLELVAALGECLAAQRPLAEELAGVAARSRLAAERALGAGAPHAPRAPRPGGTGTNADTSGSEG